MCDKNNVSFKIYILIILLFLKLHFHFLDYWTESIVYLLDLGRIQGILGF